MRARHLISSTILLLIALLGSPLQAAEQQAILVLDASGSMWGQIDGKAKITIARDVVADMLKEWDSLNPIGLVTYGHRRKGDCKDIEPVIPLGPLDVNAFNKAVRELKPKGKTPMTEAVRQAAHLLKYTEDKATVILVSDGKETCKADPCAIAKELEEQGVDFTAHVISFDVKDKEGLAQLKCIANNTGGEFMSASNASGLKQALSQAVKVVETPKIDPKAPVNLRAYTVLKPGGEKFGGSWFTIYKETQDAAGETKRAKVTSNGYYAEANFKLPPGDYIVHAKNGAANAEVPITIEPGKPLLQEINLNAAKVRLYSVLKAEGEQFGGSWFTVYREEPDEFNKPKRIKVTSNGYYAQTDFIVHAGEYIAHAKNGAADGEARITVEAGKAMMQEINLNAGKLKLHSVLTEGGKQHGGSWFTVFYEEPDEFGKAKRFKLTSNGYYAETTFIVPARDYIVQAKNGAAVAETPTTVTAGNGTAQEINLNAAPLKLVSILTEGGQPYGGSWFTIFKETKDQFGKAERTKVTSNGYYAETTFLVGSGDYIVHAKNGAAGAETRISLEAAKGASQNINLNAGKLKLRTVNEVGGKPVGGSWFTVYKEVTDDQGNKKRAKVTSNGYYAETEFLVPAGDYVVSATNKKRTSEGTVIVSAGKGTEQELVLPPTQ